MSGPGSHEGSVLYVTPAGWGQNSQKCVVRVCEVGDRKSLLNADSAVPSRTIEPSPVARAKPGQRLEPDR
jgi:hypothetical protein